MHCRLQVWIYHLWQFAQVMNLFTSRAYRVSLVQQYSTVQYSAWHYGVLRYGRT